MGGLAVPTYGIVMVVLMTISLYFAFAGGQLTIMTTDCIEGVVSSVLYLVIVFTILSLFSYHQMGQALMQSKPGESYLDPFDIGKRTDFGYGYLVLSFAITCYMWRGNTWVAGFAASAKKRHEGQMAVLLGMWRNMAALLMGGLIGLGAFTLINHPDFATYSNAIRRIWMPPFHWRTNNCEPNCCCPPHWACCCPRESKALCAVLLMGFVAGTASSLHNFSSMMVQDMFLPILRAADFPQPAHSPAAPHRRGHRHLHRRLRSALPHQGLSGLRHPAHECDLSRRDRRHRVGRPVLAARNQPGRRASPPAGCVLSLINAYCPAILDEPAFAA